MSDFFAVVFLVAAADEEASAAGSASVAAAPPGRLGKVALAVALALVAFFAAGFLALGAAVATEGMTAPVSISWALTLFLMARPERRGAVFT